MKAGRVWLFAFGYFAAYVPYSALTKALSSGALGDKRSGLELVPLTTATSVLAMLVFVFASGWWRDAGKGPLGLPWPGKWTALSGVCTAVIVLTTTLAYTFEGVSIVLMMVLMRGGVLALAPVTDLFSGRKVHPESWVALGLSMLALLIASPFTDAHFTVIAAIDALAYLGAYFFRLRAMSHLAKTGDAKNTRRFFVEEQLVGTPVALAALAVAALIAPEALSAPLRRGFSDVPFHLQAGWIVLTGICSQGTGVFGALVLLDSRENTFTVPVNRISSVWAGVVATTLSAVWLGTTAVPGQEWFACAVLTLAIAVLAAPAISRKLRGVSAP